MENNEYYSTDNTEENKDELILMGFNELPYSVYNDECPSMLIINKTKNQFWMNGPKAFNHASQMAQINPITLNEIKQWQN